MNKVILIGHLTRDIELRYTPAGVAVGNSSIAVNTNYKDKNGEKKQEACFIEISAFGKSAEIMNQYLSKGKKVLVEGRLKFDMWEKDGTKHSKHSVLIESFEFLEAKGDSENSYSAPTAQAPRERKPAPQQDLEIDDDSIPF